MIDKHARPTKLLWLDLEMTGLDPMRDVILEVVAEVTGFDFKKIARYEAVIHQPEEVLQQANDWAKAQHAASGLLDKVRTIGGLERSVESGLAEFIKQNFGAEPAVLAGNSIRQDRAFIQRWWTEVEVLLHYRMLDVSALKVYMQGKYGIEYKKKEVHRAFYDLQESMAEWQYYIRWLRGQGEQND